MVSFSQFNHDILYLFREKDLHSIQEAQQHHIAEKDQQYNSLVKSLKDRVSLFPPISLIFYQTSHFEIHLKYQSLIRLSGTFKSVLPSF